MAGENPGSGPAGEKPEAPGQWQDLAASGLTGLVMVVGAPDSGKSTLVRWLAAHLPCSRPGPAVLDADPGQSQSHRRAKSADPGDADAGFPQAGLYAGTVPGRKQGIQFFFGRLFAAPNQNHLVAFCEALIGIGRVAVDDHQVGVRLDFAAQPGEGCPRCQMMFPFVDCYPHKT